MALKMHVNVIILKKVLRSKVIISLLVKSNMLLIFDKIIRTNNRNLSRRRQGWSFINITLLPDRFMLIRLL